MRGTGENRAGTRTARDTVITSLDLNSINSEIVFGKTLEDMINEYVSEINTLKQENALMEKGTLIIRKKNRAVHFSVCDHGTEKGISNNPDAVYNLARRRYNELRIAELSAIVYRIKTVQATMKTECKSRTCIGTAARFADAGLDVLRIVFSEEQNNWIDENYTPNPFHPENLTYRTKSGIYVRSNGELKIANALEKMGIPYRNDDIVQIQDKQSGRSRSFFADFKIPNLRGGVSLLEHLGGFGYEGYADNAMERLNAYSNSEHIKNEEIFWSFESTVNNPGKLKNLIFRMLMPF